MKVVKFLDIDEKPKHNFFVNAGICIINPDILKMIPKNEFYDMPALIQSILKNQENVSAFPIREYWMDIGRIDDLNLAQEEFSKEFQQ
tara:strand:- start:35 stop:298 length:264 start_codon:yes stop_codon:yes gene_type:complete